MHGENGENQKSNNNGGKFDSVFDTLRILENKNSDKTLTFKWNNFAI